MKHFSLLIFLLILSSCTTTNDVEITDSNTLASYIHGKSIESGAVIACAASEENSETILAFFYPKSGAVNYKYFETNSIDVEHSNFENYTEVNLETTPVFNGYLRKFTRESSEEKWVIITFELENEVKISNPIKLKHLSKPSVWNTAVTINQDASLMPEFTWEANAVGDNAIYFQVITNSENNLLSGTYTYQNHFQYYNLSNVVLNITTETPPELMFNAEYNFTLMDVSLDNWVNLVIQKPFIVE